MELFYFIFLFAIIHTIKELLELLMNSIKVVSFDFGGVFTPERAFVPYEPILFELVSREFEKHISRREVDSFFASYLAHDYKARKKHRSGDLYSYFNSFLKKKG